MKKIYVILCLFLAVAIDGCKQKKEVEPEFPFYQVISGGNEAGKDWKLEHFYSNVGISNYENTIANGIDGIPIGPDWTRDNYYTFFKDGYGLCFEKGIINPYVNQETAESWDSEKGAYKYIQFDYSGGKTVQILNRVQKPAFLGEWKIISLKSDEMVLYQQEKEFDQEHVIVFKTTRGGI
jgi:hypothetical protein